jgi:hypothetical protein
MLKGPLRNRAVTLRLTVIHTLQVPVLVQAPNQALKECPLFGTAVSVTAAPWVN